jgi:hypothetical protein
MEPDGCVRDHRPGGRNLAVMTRPQAWKQHWTGCDGEQNAAVAIDEFAAGSSPPDCASLWFVKIRGCLVRQDSNRR